MRKFAVIGHPIGHTMSPPIHKRLFALSGHDDVDYQVYDIAPEALAENMNTLRKLDGFNVTIPHKLAVIPYLKELSPTAEEYGSVNTVSCRDKGNLIGYNTDIDGFLRAVGGLGASLSGKVLLLGSGGVGRTFAIETAKQGADLTIAVRKSDIPAARKIKSYIEKNVSKKSVDVILLEQAEDTYPFIINATPVGMHPMCGQSPVGDAVLSKCAYYFDAVYNPIETKAMRVAKKNGAKVYGGMTMLVWQAVAAHEIWDNASYKEEDIKRLISDMEMMVKEQFA